MAPLRAAHAAGVHRSAAWRGGTGRLVARLVPDGAGRIYRTHGRSCSGFSTGLGRRLQDDRRPIDVLGSRRRPYEGGGYWFDGLFKLGGALHDDALINKAKGRLDVVVSRVGPSGVLFFWWLDKHKPEDVEAATKNAGGEANAWPIWANGLLGRGWPGTMPDQEIVASSRHWKRRTAATGIGWG